VSGGDDYLGVDEGATAIATLFIKETVKRKDGLGCIEISKLVVIEVVMVGGFENGYEKAGQILRGLG